MLELTGHGHTHDHDHDRIMITTMTMITTMITTMTTITASDHGRGRLRGAGAVMVPFGAAASPDLTILPVFLAATAAGIATAVGSLLIFAAVTIGTIVELTLAATRGGYEIRGQWLERWGNALTALVLILVGALVFTGVI